MLQQNSHKPGKTRATIFQTICTWMVRPQALSIQLNPSGIRPMLPSKTLCGARTSGTNSYVEILVLRWSGIGCFHTNIPLQEFPISPLQGLKKRCYAGKRYHGCETVQGKQVAQSARYPIHRVANPKCQHRETMGAGIAVGRSVLRSCLLFISRQIGIDAAERLQYPAPHARL